MILLIPCFENVSLTTPPSLVTILVNITLTRKIIIIINIIMNNNNDYSLFMV